MMSSYADGKPHAEDLTSLEKARGLWDEPLHKLKKQVTFFILFHSIFFLIACIEIAFFVAFLTWLSQSHLLAFTLALFFLTLFSYSFIRLYFQTKKPEQLLEICDDYLAKCKESIRYQEGIPEHHIAIAALAQKFARELHDKEYSFYLPRAATFRSLAPTFEKFSAFCHWKDLHKMKEILLSRAIEEHIKVVKCEPTHLEAHAALANAYVMLSSLYSDPRKYDSYDEERWIPPERVSKEMEKKFRKTAERAIEEFKILNDYAPNDPWVHIQLAYSYHDLQMPLEEIQEYEIILTLRPDDTDSLFKLGMLYFQQGHNAKGLQIFEKLKIMHPKKGENLIKFYGAYDLQL